MPNALGESSTLYMQAYHAGQKSEMEIDQSYTKYYDSRTRQQSGMALRRFDKIIAIRITLLDPHTVQRKAIKTFRRWEVSFPPSSF